MQSKQSSRSRRNQPGSAPVLRLRQLIVGIVFVVVLIAWPMFMVWKQIYITNISTRESSLSDTINVLSKEAVSLRLYNEKLSSIQRIEAIAKASLSLDYPTSAQIIVIRETKKNVRETFFALFRRTFSRERG